jgi:hypothetical protein
MQEASVNIASPEALDAFKAAEAEFFEWRSKLNALQTRAEQQNALAVESETEAASHKKAIAALIRSESVDKAELHALTAKHTAALSLAAQYRTFADELLLEKEEARPNAVDAAEKYYSAWERAVSSAVEAEFCSILEDIRDRLLRAVKLKELAFRMAPKVARGLTSDAYGHDNLTDLAFGEIKRHLAEGLEGFSLDLGSNDALALVEKKPDIRPFTRAEIQSPLAIIKLRQDLARKRGEVQHV